MTHPAHSTPHALSYRGPEPESQSSLLWRIFWPFLLGGFACTGPLYAYVAIQIFTGPPGFGIEVAVLIFGFLIVVGLPPVSAVAAVLGAMAEQLSAKRRGRAPGLRITWVLGLISPVVSLMAIAVGNRVIRDEDWLFPLCVPLAAFAPFAAGWMLLRLTRR